MKRNELVALSSVPRLREGKRPWAGSIMGSIASVDSELLWSSVSPLRPKSRRKSSKHHSIAIGCAEKTGERELLASHRTCIHSSNQFQYGPGCQLTSTAHLCYCNPMNSGISNPGSLPLNLLLQPAPKLRTHLVIVCIGSSAIGYACPRHDILQEVRLSCENELKSVRRCRPRHCVPELRAWCRPRVA